MFKGLVSEKDYWGHQHYLVRDDHPESKQLELEGGGFTEKAIVPGANFARAIFCKVDLSRSDFIGGDFSSATFMNCNLKESYFKNCNLEVAAFIDCEMESTSFPNSNLRNVKFISDISKVRFNYAYGSNEKFVSRLLHKSTAVPLIFGATRHKIYIGCQTWDTESFIADHRQIIKREYHYYAYYKRYRHEILELLVSKGWIDGPSLFASLLNYLPIWNA